MYRLRLDIIDNVNIADLPSLRSRPDTPIGEQQGARIMFAFLDQDRAVSPFAAAPDGSNPLRDVRVRKALQVGVDGNAIIGHVLEGSGVAAGQMTIPGRFGASPDLKVPDYDPRQAKELLAAAGYDKGFSLTLHGTSDSYPAGDRVLQAIAQYYARLGIKVSVVTETTSVAYATMNRRDFSLLFIGYGGEGFSLDGLAHMAMPTVNLALGNIALVLRLTRAGARENLLMDYVRFARAKGLSPRRVLFVHVLKNIMIPVVTVIGLEFGSTIAFSVVTESVFSWPGMGKLIIDSINLLDRPVIVAYLMVIVLMFVAINLVVDLLYTALDPRVRLDSRT